GSGILTSQDESGLWKGTRFHADPILATVIPRGRRSRRDPRKPDASAGDGVAVVPPDRRAGRHPGQRVLLAPRVRDGEHIVLPRRMAHRGELVPVGWRYGGNGCVCRRGRGDRLWRGRLFRT